jgi:hypothetical protein
MTSYSLELPKDLLDEIHRLATENEVSPEQWLLAAIAEKVGTAKTERLLRCYVGNFDPEKFEQILARVPDVEPLPGDEL